MTAIAIRQEAPAVLPTPINFELPDDLVAHEPPEARGLNRDGVRLMVSRISTNAIAHTRFSHFPDFLRRGDVLVINTSQTINAAFEASREATNGTSRLATSRRLRMNWWPGSSSCDAFRHWNEPASRRPAERGRPPARRSDGETRQPLHGRSNRAHHWPGQTVGRRAVAPGARARLRRASWLAHTLLVRAEVVAAPVLPDGFRG